MHLPKSKMDQFREGTTLTLSPASDPSCPVIALKRLFEAQPKPSSAPLFSRLLGPFNKRWFSSRITQALLDAGINPSHYSGHSFRRGAANTAVAAGAPLQTVKLMGRWKSNSIDRYFTPHSSNSLGFAASKFLHLTPSRQESSLHLTHASTNLSLPAESLPSCPESLGPIREVVRSFSSVCQTIRDGRRPKSRFYLPS